MRLSFVTTCMNRLDHLKQTLPLRVGIPNVENIVVDWSCPQGTGDWVEANYPEVKVVRVPGQDRFQHGRSRNAGFSLATGQFICQADADLIVNPSFFTLLDTFEEDAYYVRMPLELFAGSANVVKKAFHSPEWRKARMGEVIDPIWEWTDDEGNHQTDQGPLTGAIVFPRAAYEEFGGYNEDLWHYGGDDIEFRAKLVFQGGLTERMWGPGHIANIPHSDTKRMENQAGLEFFQSRRAGGTLIQRKWGPGWMQRAVALIKERNKK